MVGWSIILSSWFLKIAGGENNEKKKISFKAYINKYP